MATTLPVMEIYHAIQGEGIRTGHSSVFVRLFGCNLRCTWCDTSYSINLDEAKKALSAHEFENLYTRYTPLELAQKIIIDFPNVPDIVITGGEPTTHMKLLLGLSQSLQEYGRHVTVETNGTLPPTTDSVNLVNLWSVSGKLANTQISEELEKRRVVNFNAWGEFIGWTQFKFVISNLEDDVEQVRQILLSTPSLKYSSIILVPNGDLFMTDPQRGWEAYRKISLLTDTPGWSSFNLSVAVLPQLHLLADGRKRFT